MINLNVTLFGFVFLFCFNFLCSHARCGCCSIVALERVGEGGLFKIERPKSMGGGAGGREWRNFGRRWAEEVGALESKIIFMDVICVFPLTQ